MRLASLLVAVLLVLWLGVRAATPPTAAPATAAPTAFSATRAMADVRAIGQRPHPVATADNQRVHAYLAGRLRALGLAVEERHYLVDPQGYAVLRRWNPEVSPAAELVDLVGVLPGHDRRLPAVALMAHTDTVWGSPGAADDSLGVAAILESLRAIEARGQPARDVVVLLTDGEELNLSGARAFWPSDAIAAHVGAVINLESRGAGGRATMFETGAGNAGMMGLFARGVAHPVANSMSVLAYRLMPNDTDFTVSREKGLPGFNFAMLGRPRYYHSPRATVDRVDPRTLQDLGDQALGIASTLASSPTLPSAPGDAVFFDVAGRGLVHYSVGTGWLVLLAATLAWGAACWRVMRAGAMRAVDLLGGGAAMLWLVAHAVLALAAFNLLSGSGGHPNYYDRLAKLSSLEWQAGLIALAALTGVFALRRWARRGLALVPTLLLGLFAWREGVPHGLLLALTLVALLTGWFASRRGATRWGGWLGAILLLLLVAVGSQAKAPLAAWIFAWPALVVGLAAALIAAADAAFVRPASFVVAALASVAIGVPLLPLAHLTFLGIGAPLAPAVAAFLPILAAAFWPLARIERRHGIALVAIAALLLVAGGIAVKIRHAPLAPTVPPYSDK